MSITKHDDLVLEGLSRDLVRLSEAYLEDNVDDARRITTRMILNLKDLYTDRPGCLMDLGEIDAAS